LHAIAEPNEPAQPLDWTKQLPNLIRGSSQIGSAGSKISDCFGGPLPSTVDDQAGQLKSVFGGKLPAPGDEPSVLSVRGG
jgi:hypothetical protein